MKQIYTVQNSLFREPGFRGRLGVAAQRDEKLQPDPLCSRHRFPHGGGLSRKRQNHFVRVAGAPVGRSVFYDGDVRRFQRGIRHYQTDRRGRTGEKAEGFSLFCAERLNERVSRVCGVRKFKVPRRADIEFSGIEVRPFEGDLHAAAHVGYVFSSHDDVIPVSAPARGVPRDLDGEH